MLAHFNPINLKAVIALVDDGLSSTLCYPQRPSSAAKQHEANNKADDNNDDQQTAGDKASRHGLSRR